MKKTSLTLLAVFVAAFGSSSLADTDRFRSTTGAECQRNVGTGKWAEFNAETNATTGETTFSFTYKIELGRDKIRRLDCTSLANQESIRQDLELRKLELEIQLLERRNREQNSNVTTGDDW